MEASLETLAAGHQNDIAGDLALCLRSLTARLRIAHAEGQSIATATMDDCDRALANFDANPSGIPAVVCPVECGYYWYLHDGRSVIHSVHRVHGRFAGRLVIQTGRVTHTGDHTSITPVDEMPGHWFGPLLSPHIPLLANRSD